MSENFRICTMSGQDYLSIESDRIDACIDYFNANNLYGISVTRHRGYKESNVDFLSKMQGVRGLVVSEEIDELEAINSLRSLEDLTLEKSKKPIDFKLLPNLHTYRGKWTPKVASISESTSIKELALWGYRSKTKNLLELAGLAQLEELELVSSQIESLDGIEQLSNVSKLALRSLSKLTDIGALSALNAQLTDLEFESCKRIDDYEPLSGCTALQHLSIEKSANIKSLAFTESLKSLREIYWVKTKLECEPTAVVAAAHIEKVIGANGDFIKGDY